MNLHEYSQNNNVEVAVLIYPMSNAAKIANVVVSSEDLGESARTYFDGIIKNSDILYRKTPQYASGFLVLTKKYTQSETEVDNLSNFFSAPATENINYRQNSITNSGNSYKKPSNQMEVYCIRSGILIPFDITKPYSYEAYQIWAQFSNPNYPKKFCHLTGKPSYVNTSMRNPVL
jgi:hypothetical protein